MRCARLSSRNGLLRLLAIAASTGCLLLAAGCRAESGSAIDPPEAKAADAGRAVMPAVDKTFDAYYAPGFHLKPLAADPIPPASPPPRANGLDDAFVDPVHATRLYRATSASDGEGGRMRHEYSRRQAFNADNSRYLAQDGDGGWHVYDARTFRHLRALDGLAGDCEPLWHPRDPRQLYVTGTNGGTRWWHYDADNGKRTLLFDFKGKTPWPKADAYWTKGEGTFSADGRYLALMATHYDPDNKQSTIYGLLTFDLEQRRIVGTLDASRFGGRFPDHISMSPSGRYAVPSWGRGEGGTRAYTRDFSENRLLLDGSEHSDLAIGPNGEDFYVYADYSGPDDGWIIARDIDSGQKIRIAPLYQGDHESYTVHISGQAFDRPGWVVLSTYDDFARYGEQTPSPTLRPEYRKVWLAELKPDGRKLGLAHVRASAVARTDYFSEPQATPSRDLSRVVFSTDFGSGTVEDYIIGLPSWALDPPAH